MKKKMNYIIIFLYTYKSGLKHIKSDRLKREILDYLIKKRISRKWI